MQKGKKNMFIHRIKNKVDQRQIAESFESESAQNQLPFICNRLPPQDWVIDGSASIYMMKFSPPNGGAGPKAYRQQAKKKWLNISMSWNSNELRLTVTAGIIRYVLHLQIKTAIKILLFYVSTSLTEVFFFFYKYDKIFIPILQKGASAKSSHCSSHAVKSHKAQLAVLQAKLPAGTKYFIIRSGVLLMWRVLCPESLRGVLVQTEKKIDLILCLSFP